MTKKKPLIELDEHHAKCPTCGASVDLRNLAEVLFHQDPAHTPKPVPSWKGSRRVK